ncbi:N/A [soil metagenome]
MHITRRATTHTLNRRGGAAVAAAAAGVAAAALFGIPSAGAAPDPCAASSIARTVGSVGTNTGIYLDAHPDTNQALTTISQQQAGPQSLAALKTYFDANPQAGSDLQAIQQPLTTLSAKCKLPITLPQLLGLLQTAQQGGGLPGGLPGSLPGAAAAAQAVAGTTGTAPAVGAAEAAAPTTVGPTPGPSAASSR